MDAPTTDLEFDSLDIYRDGGSYRATFDEETVPASLAIVSVLSNALDEDPVSLRPLYETINCDALDQLMRASDTANGDVHLTWRYESYTVTIHSSGLIEAEPPEDHHAEEPTRVTG